MGIALLPPWLLRRLALPSDVRHHLNVLLSLAVLALAFVIVDVPRLLGSVPHVCLFQGLFGVPCPGCGVTRSLSLVARGRFATSMAVQPCGLLLVIIVAVQSATRMARIAGWLTCERAGSMVRLLDRAVVSMLLGFWIFRLATGS